jgi:Secretion system C-terminal sorting domain
MKKKITLLSMLLAATFVSKAQITITASDVPLPATVNLMEYTAASLLPKGANQNWNVSANPQFGATSIIYNPETVASWVGIGTDIYRVNSKYLTSSLTYNIFQEFDKANNGFNEVGFNVPAQSYGISAFTGNTADSLLIPEQDVFYTSPKTIIPFPFTSTSTFNSSGRRVVAFTINAPALGLSNTPFTHVLNEVRIDSVIGWGKMRVYTPGGASQPYDVLMDQIINYSLDSFYMAGSPAPAAILTAFGVSQAQKVNINNAIHFYRKGHFSYLYRLNFGADNTFTNFTAAFSHTDDVSFAAGISGLQSIQYSTIIYPNPASNNDIHLRMIGTSTTDFTSYSITNSIGAIVASAKANWTADEIILPTSTLSSGVYFINMTNKVTGQKISETFKVN